MDNLKFMCSWKPGGIPGAKVSVKVGLFGKLVRILTTDQNTECSIGILSILAKHSVGDNHRVINSLYSNMHDRGRGCQVHSVGVYDTQALYIDHIMHVSVESVTPCFSVTFSKTFHDFLTLTGSRNAIVVLIVRCSKLFGMRNVSFGSRNLPWYSLH